MENLLILGNDSSHVDLFLKYADQQNIENNIFLWGDSIKTSVSYASKFKGCTAIETALELEVLIAQIDNVYIASRFADDHFASLLYVLANAKDTKKIFVDKILVNSQQQGKFIEELARLKSVKIVSGSPYRFNDKLADILSETKERNDLEFVTALYCHDLGNDYRFLDPGFYFIHLAELLYSISDDVTIVDYTKTPAGLDLTLALSKQQIKVKLDDTQDTEDILLHVYQNTVLQKTINVSETNAVSGMYDNYFGFMMDFFSNEIDDKQLRSLFSSHLKVIGFLEKIRKVIYA
jgi:hypothetical protein